MSGLGKWRIDGVATAATMGALVCWGTGPNFIHYLGGHLDVYSQNFWRYLTAALLWMPYLLVLLVRGRVDHRIWKRALVPVAANIAMQCCWASALYHIQPGFASLITKIGVLWTAGFSFILFADERVLLRSRWFWVGLVLSLAGVAGVIAFQEDFSFAGSWKGILLAQAAAITWSLYTVAARWAVRDISIRLSFSVISMYTMLGLAVIAVLFGKPGAALQMGWKPWGAVLIPGILSIGLSHVMYYTASKRIGATIPSLLLLSSPVWVLLVSWFWFEERLTIPQIVAGAILLLGAGLALRAQEKMVKEDSK